MSFIELNLRNELNLAISKWGYISPTPIQKSAIPLSLQNKDIFGQSHTGTGKTAAFVLPILNNLTLGLNSNQALIVCPTRELSIQVAKQIKKYSYFLKGVNIALLCGGSNIRLQFQDLKKSNIVVGTPGRISDHLQRKTLKLNSLKTIILDEADEMLKMGFKKDIDYIFANAPDKVQTLLFSATISPEVKKIADNYQKNPILISFEEQKKEEQKNIKQFYYYTKDNNKGEALVSLYKQIKPNLSIIFSNTKSYTKKIADILKSHDIRAIELNGDKTQRERETAMRLFREGKIKVLVATDVAARGIHVDDIDYVFNFDLPNEFDYYIHRVGRTGRAGKTGNAVSIINNRKQFEKVKLFEKSQGLEIQAYDEKSKFKSFINLNRPVGKSSLSKNKKWDKKYSQNKKTTY